MKTEMTELIKLLPEGYEKACFETKAITRKRTIADPKDLLVCFCITFMKTIPWLIPASLHSCAA